MSPHFNDNVSGLERKPCLYTYLHSFSFTKVPQRVPLMSCDFKTCSSFASPPPGGDSYRRSGRDDYRDSYRDYRERERGRYGGGYDTPREYGRYGGSTRGYGDYYERAYERNGGGSGAYDRFDRYERGYDKGYDGRYDRASYERAYDRYYDEYSGGGGGRYSDYRPRSRSPPRDYYGSGGRERA